MAIKLQLRRDTAANWAAANPTLMDGEIGYDKTSNKFKVGNGSSAWSSLDYALTGPTGPQGPMGPPPVILAGPTLITVAGVPLKIDIAFLDSYTTYSVSAVTGTVTLSGSTITYTGTTIGTDTLTIHAGDDSRDVEITVMQSSLSPAPSPAPAIGAALQGGFYTGAVWDKATTAAGSYTVGIGTPTLTIPAPDLSKFYIGQSVRLTPTNSNSAMMEGTVIAGSEDQLTLNLTSVVYGAGTYTAWTIAIGYKIIVAPRSSGEIASVMYKTVLAASPAATRTLTNGPAATLALQAENTNPSVPLNPMAQWVTNLNTSGGIGTYTDWYIPARDELELIWRNLKPITNTNSTGDRALASNSYTTDANYPDSSLDLGDMGKNSNSIPLGAAYTSIVPAQTSVTAFAGAGAEAMQSGNYWSSSEYSSNLAWYQNYTTSSPGNQYNTNKFSSFRARAVRRSIL